MLKKVAVGLMALMGSLAIQAQEMSTEDRILKALSEARPDFEFTSVRPSPIDGLYQAQVVGGPILYVSPDAQLMIAGEMFNIEPGGFARYEDPAIVEKRKQLAAKLEQEDTIDFAPEGESKAVVYVFTDVDCGFCRRLHNQMTAYRDEGERKPGYNDLGIEIRYLAYPRAGVGSPSSRKLETAWCADDQQAVMNQLKNLQSVDSQACDNNPVAQHYRLGAEFGVNGTPALVLPNGSVQPGYVPPEQLAQILGL